MEYVFLGKASGSASLPPGCFPSGDLLSVFEEGRGWTSMPDHMQPWSSDNKSRSYCTESHNNKPNNLDNHLKA